MENLRKIFAILVVYGLFLLVLIFFKNEALMLENSIFLRVNVISNPILDGVLLFITYFGSSVFWLLFIILLWLKMDRKLSLYLLYAFVIDTVLNIFMKFLFLRPRPPELFLKLDMEASLSPGLPSGHTQRAFSGAVIIGKYYKKARIIFYTLAFFVAVSRIYLGLHYPIDVITGCLNGLFVGLITLNLNTRKLQNRLEKFGKKLF